MNLVAFHFGFVSIEKRQSVCAAGNCFEIDTSCNKCLNMYKHNVKSCKSEPTYFQVENKKQQIVNSFEKCFHVLDACLLEVLVLGCFVTNTLPIDQLSSQTLKSVTKNGICFGMPKFVTKTTFQLGGSKKNGVQVTGFYLKLARTKTKQNTESQDRERECILLRYLLCSCAC